MSPRQGPQLSGGRPPVSCQPTQRQATSRCVAPYYTGCIAQQARSLVSGPRRVIMARFGASTESCGRRRRCIQVDLDSSQSAQQIFYNLVHACGRRKQFLKRTVTRNIMGKFRSEVQRATTSCWATTLGDFLLPFHATAAPVAAEVGGDFAPAVLRIRLQKVEERGEGDAPSAAGD